jgi:Phage capsid family
MLTYVRQLTAERESLTQSATTLADAAASESRDLTDTEQASMASWAERCAHIDGQLATFGDQLESQRAYAALRSRLAADDDPPTGPGRALALAPGGMNTRTPEPQGWGELFVASDAFHNYRGRGSSEEIELPGLFARAPIMISTFQGTLPPYYFTPTPWQMTTPLLDVLGRVTTSSNTIEWYTWPGAYPLAAVVPEGAAKPEALFDPTPHTDSLDTYAHYRALSRQALEDIPQIQSIVEGALRGGILAALEAAAATALADAGSGIPTSSGTDFMAAIRVAIAHVQTRGYSKPNAVLLNPTDFAQLDLDVMGVTTNGPQSVGSVWGIPPIAVGAIPAGTAYVGDFSAAVTLFARSTVSSFMTDSHADYFIKNLLVILAEQRALVAVTEPNAAEKVTVTAAPGAE